MRYSYALARACAVLSMTAGLLVLAGTLLGFELLAYLPGSGPVMRPGTALGFVLCGACVWQCATPLPPQHSTRLLGGLIALGGVAAMAVFAITRTLTATGRSLPGFLPQWDHHAANAVFATGAGFVLLGLSMAFLDYKTSKGGRNSLQVPLVPVFWMGYVGLIGWFYGAPARDTFLVHVMPTAFASALFLVTGAGILIIRPHHGLTAVISSPAIGGLLARTVLPLVVLLPFTIGWLRLWTLQSENYSLESGFTMFTATNVFIFALFTWITAGILNRVDRNRQRAYESLRDANRELSRVNHALKEKINEQNRTEEARKKTELQLFQSQKMEAMGTLASGIAHDFNNILTVILLNVDDARDTAPKDPHLQKSLQEIKKAGTRASDLIRQIMTFGRKTPGDREPLQVESVVMETVEMLRYTLPPDVRIRTEFDAGAPRIRADATQLQQILINLGTNAAHAMADGGGTLEIMVKPAVIDPDRASLYPDLQPGSYALITVSDTGHGMDEETAKRIFDPFFTTKAPGKGTGLGLSVAHGIMRLHDGYITVYSEPDRGTIFHLYFPTAAPAPVIPDAPVPRDTHGDGERIMCVDDDTAILTAIGRRLERLGYRVTLHPDPFRALEEFRRQPHAFDLVLTDYSMPGMSGRVLARELLGIRRDLPVVVMSGFFRPEDAEEARESGVRHVVLKPDVEELEAIVHRLLAEKHTEAEKHPEKTSDQGDDSARPPARD